MIYFLKSLRDLKSAAVALVAFHGFMTRTEKEVKAGGCWLINMIRQWMPCSYTGAWPRVLCVTLKREKLAEL